MRIVRSCCWSVIFKRSVARVKFEKKKMAKTGQDLRCLSRLITAAGYLFSVLTVAINLADVATDIFVAVEFYRDGEMLWFWLVMGSLILAHIIYAISVAFLLPANVDAWEGFNVVPAPGRLFIGLLIAQFVPVINLVLTCMSKGDPTDDIDGPASQAEQQLDRAALETADDVARSQLLNKRLEEGAKVYVMRYGLFFVETAVEAAPQAVIQLLAISFLGRSTPVQLVSLCFSFFSITSKLFLLCRSYDVRVMMFNFLLFAHDVFSTYYLFSTVIAAETRPQTTFFGLDVSWLAFIWLWKVIVTMTMAFISCCGVWISSMWLDIESGNRENCAKSFSAGLFGLLLYAPGALIYETLKTSYYVLSHAIGWEGRIRVDARMAIVTSFLRRDDASSTRKRFMLEYFIAHQLAVVDAQAKSLQGLPTVTHNDVRREQRRLAAEPLGTSLPTDAQSLTIIEAFYSRPEVFYLPLRMYLRDCAVAGTPLSNTRLERMVVQAYTLRMGECVDRKESLAWRQWRHNWNNLKCEKRFVTCWWILATTVATVGQLFSFAYPFINTGFQAETHNALQMTCFVALCFCLFAALALAPWAVYSHHIDALFGPFLGPYRTAMTEELLLQAIADFYRPPHIQVLQSLVPTVVLPTEVVGIAALYVTAHDVGLGQLTAAECEAIKLDLEARPFSNDFMDVPTCVMTVVVDDDCASPDRETILASSRTPDHDER
jgi:hypothetical protein